jgi:hypothetical protein
LHPSPDPNESPSYGSRPISDFVRGPLLRTPQGITCLVSCALSLAAGVVWLFLSPHQRTIPAFSMAEAFFYWPVLLLLGFVGISLGMNLRMKVVKPSLFATLVMAGLGIDPFVWPYVHVYCNANAGTLLCRAL